MVKEKNSDGLTRVLTKDALRQTIRVVLGKTEEGYGLLEDASNLIRSLARSWTGQWP